MFWKYLSNYQSQYFANTWQQTLRNKEVIKNSYRATGDIKKAKTFMHNVSSYTPHTHFVDHGEHVIYSFDPLAIASEPAYTFA